MSEKLLNPADVAERLNVSRASAYSLLKQGVIPSVRMGKMIRVRREDSPAGSSPKSASGSTDPTR